MGAILAVPNSDIYELLDVAYADGAVDIEPYLRRVVTRSLEWFGSSGISVFLRDGETENFSLAFASGLLSTVPKDARIRIGNGIAGLAMAEQKARLLIDPRSEADLSARGIQRKESIGSSLIVPLVTKREGCIGVMNVARSADADPFQESDLEAADALARQIALAVNNARVLVKANRKRSKLQTAIESVGFGLVLLEADGRFSDFSPEAATILGSHPNEATTWDQFVYHVASAFQQPLRHGIDRARKGLSYRFRASHNELIYAGVVSPLQSGGVIIALHDVTEHERSREGVDRVQRLAEIGQMTASIAHEIRNPLASIISSAKLIKDDTSNASEFADIISTEASKLATLCDEFLSFAKPLSLEYEPIQLGDLAKQVSARLMSEFMRASVRLEVNISADEPILYADPRRIEQVLRNLLLNALQHSPEGSTVTVEVTTTGILRVLDQGSGMDAATLDKLFIPFFSTRTNGTGLGLSVVRKIADAHRAPISVQSEVGKGTIFAIDFSGKESN
jgi:signal transduction histidine kinase